MTHRILVTGATGYIAKHIVRRALDAGHTVIGSTRNADRDAEMRAALAPALETADALDRYRTFALDLTRDEGWEAAMEGVDVLMHTASPFPMSQPRDAEDLIRPAVGGVRRAFAAAKSAGVNNVVLTSSTVAVTGSDREKTRFDESDWTDPDGKGVSAYAQSKTLAERAAWDFAETEAPDMRLSVINPSFVMGAPLDEAFGTSVNVIRRLMRGTDPLLPRIGFPCCDVGDVAEAHVRAMETDAAAGHRHLICDRFLWFEDMAASVRDAVPSAKPARRVAPDFLMRMVGLFDPGVRGLIPELGRKFECGSDRMRRVLGITPRDARESVFETAQWVSEQGHA